jgi:CDP-2,3-bis-(O-geranylgeranyl)-sn-glycerol synthase
VDAWVILQALWLFLPAYVANMSPVFSSKLIPKWSAPIDGGRMAKDGKRVMGDGKTWRGLAGGAVAGGFTALAMSAIAPAAGAAGWLAGWDFSAAGYYGGAIGGGAPPCPTDVSPCGTVDIASRAWYAIFLFGAIVGFFALSGDAIESYFKRRRGKERGAPWIPFDQLDFVVFGLVGMLVAAQLLADGWLMEAMFGHWGILATLLMGSPVLHLSVNRIGYWLKLKDVPW